MRFLRDGSFVARPLSLALVAALSVACGGGEEDALVSPAGSAGVSGAGAGGAAGAAGSAGAGGDVDAPLDPAGALYPSMRVLLDRAIAPSCAAPSGCHHEGTKAPLDLSTDAAFLGAFGARCQAQKGNRAAIADECEPQADRLVFADGVDRAILRIDVAASAPTPPMSVKVRLDGPAGSLASVSLARMSDGGDKQLFLIPVTGAVAEATDDPAVVTLDVSALGEAAAAWDTRVYPRSATDVLEGDPNGNGKAGAALGFRQIVAGQPGKSLFYRSLLGDQYGPKMPMTDTGWGALETRALYCFLRSRPAGEVPTPASLTQPIPYASCPPDPDAPKVATDGFPFIVGLFSNKCSMSACHGAVPGAANVDLVPTADNLAASVIGKPSIQKPGSLLIAPGDPKGSYLLCKLDPSCADRAPGTDPMPRNQPALDDDARKKIADWISAGAPLK